MYSLTHKRGDIWLAELGQRIGSEQAGVRPVLIIQNDRGNMFSPTVIVASLSTKKRWMPTHVDVFSSKVNIPQDSTILLEQIRTIDKAHLIKKMLELDAETMEKVDKCLMISLGLIVTPITPISEE